MTELEKLIKKGDTYGMLTLTGKYEFREKSHLYVECLCECGAIVMKRFAGIYKRVKNTCGNRKCMWKLRKIPIEKGDRYGRLTLTGNDRMDGRIRFLEAECDCGVIGFYRMGQIRSGNTSSCGCLQRERASLASLSHGYTSKNMRHPVYNTWCGVKTRCRNEKSEFYPDYGGRGINMFDDWANDFGCFIRWSLSNGWSKGLTLDRIDNDKGYYPENCRWTTPKIQSSNKRNTVHITAFGETKCASDWFKDDRCKMKSLCGLIRRIKTGWNHEEAIVTLSKNLKNADIFASID